MALKINMKPRDSVYIGSSAITVASDGNVTLLIDGDAPVLRGSERIAEPNGDDPMVRIQYIIQQMYLLRDIASFHEDYFTLAQKLIQNDTEMAPHIARINCHLVQGEFYKALKTVRDIAGQAEPATSAVRVLAK
jgi:flagellar biosynthesis repressor protein FlbT